ncbi:MAG TPA: AAA family ATPase [Terriglobales bacterium]|nr:AAA family ATPase [Terriglobales bacterium]
MRKWMRERLKRRKKKDVSEVEATGRIGQPLPSGAEPLRPSYPEAMLRGAEAASAPREAQPVKDTPRQPAKEPPRQHGAAPSKAEPRLVVETQPESPTVPPAGASEATLHPPEKSPKAPKGVVVLTIGLPGSGKTTWYKRRGVTPLSSDMLRNILFDDITEQRYQGLVFSTLRSLLRARLIAKMPWNYVDATNLSPGERKQWIKMAKGLGYEVQAVFFDVPLEVCLERNKRRERVVPEDIMRRMAAKLKPPSFEEGFSKIVVVRVKKTD